MSAAPFHIIGDNMKVFDTAKHWAGKITYAALKMFPERAKNKMALLIYLLQNEPDSLMVNYDRRKWQDVTLEKIDRHFCGLDAQSLRTIKEFILKTRVFPLANPRFHHPFIWPALCSGPEYQIWAEVETQMLEAKRKYQLGEDANELSSLVYHHGLKDLSPGLKEYIRGKVFIDAGAFVGDSSLVMLEYGPDKIIAFEPVPSIARQFEETMRRNAIPSDRVELVVRGLSDSTGEVCFCENNSGSTCDSQGGVRVDLVTLDEYLQQQLSNVACGFIKADLEGMGLAMLKGSIGTIRRDRPILSLSIYHNQEEFWGIYDLLRSLDLGYVFKIEKQCAPWENHELTLIATPSLS
ncbi:MAG: hypothetical protein BWX54_01383 [Verrucomicrobia bacterium ADurb.Bin018]|nr:MAG: hypothetical protein BWX54_01383 [Verrucomicrobia bacterium ADurb.Bin018]